MSCNGCRVLRKGCNDKCILRQSLQGIQPSQAQSNATVFVAKFFGRAGLMSFLSAVSHSQRPTLFQSLLFEACGRTINPVTGAVGLLWTGKWHVCQSAVETVLRGGALHAIPEFSSDASALDSSSGVNIDFFRSSTPGDDHLNLDFSQNKAINGHDFLLSGTNLDLCLNQQQQQSFSGRMTAGGRVSRRPEKWRAETPSLNSDESETMTFESNSPTAAYNNNNDNNSNNNSNMRRLGGDTKLLKLFF